MNPIHSDAKSLEPLSGPASDKYAPETIARCWAQRKQNPVDPTKIVHKDARMTRLYRDWDRVATGNGKPGDLLVGALLHTERGLAERAWTTGPPPTPEFFANHACQVDLTCTTPGDTILGLWLRFRITLAQVQLSSGGFPDPGGLGGTPPPDTTEPHARGPCGCPYASVWNNYAVCPDCVSKAKQNLRDASKAPRPLKETTRRPRLQALHCALKQGQEAMKAMVRYQTRNVPTWLSVPTWNCTASSRYEYTDLYRSAPWVTTRLAGDHLEVYRRQCTVLRKVRSLSVGSSRPLAVYTDARVCTKATPNGSSARSNAPDDDTKSLATTDKLLTKTDRREDTLSDDTFPGQQEDGPVRVTTCCSEHIVSEPRWAPSEETEEWYEKKTTDNASGPEWSRWSVHPLSATMLAFHEKTRVYLPFGDTWLPATDESDFRYGPDYMPVSWPALALMQQQEVHYRWLEATLWLEWLEYHRAMGNTDPSDVRVCCANAAQALAWLAFHDWWYLSTHSDTGRCDDACLVHAPGSERFKGLSGRGDVSFLDMDARKRRLYTHYTWLKTCCDELCALPPRAKGESAQHTNPNLLSAWTQTLHENTVPT